MIVVIADAATVTPIYFGSVRNWKYAFYILLFGRNDTNVCVNVSSSSGKEKKDIYGRGRLRSMHGLCCFFLFSFFASSI